MLWPPRAQLRREKVAIDCLKVSGWNTDTAVDYFYASGLSSTVVAVDPRAIDHLFQKYKGALVCMSAPRAASMRWVSCSQGGGGGGALSTAPASLCCAPHADSDGDRITAEGVMRFCSDLGVEPADPVVVSEPHGGRQAGRERPQGQAAARPTWQHRSWPLRHRHASLCCGGVHSSPAQLVVAYYMNAATMGEFTKEEFSQGLLKLNADNVEKLKR